MKKILMLGVLLLLPFQSAGFANEKADTQASSVFGPGHEEKEYKDKAGLPLSVTGSGYFAAAKKYNDAVRLAAENGDFSKTAQTGMNLQRSIDTAAYDPGETAKIVGQAADSLCIQDAGGKLQSESILKKMFLLQQVQISQNKLIIRLLTEIAHPKKTDSK